MRSYLKVSVIFLLILVLTIPFLTGCGQPKVSDADKDEKTVRIAMFILVRANSYDQARIDGVENKAKEYNAQVDIFSCEFNTLEQINQIQDAITANKYDVFIIHPNDSNAVVPVVKEALKENIVVIAADAPIGPNTRSLEPYPEGVKTVIGRTGWTTGKWLGEAVVKAAEGKEKSKVAYLIGSQALTIDQDRFEGLKEVIKDYPGIEIVSFQEAQYRRDLAREIMQNVFQAQPDIDIVVSSGDQMTLGAYDAAKEAGIEGNIKFIGNGCSKEGWEALRDGVMFASYADIPYTQGELLVEYAVKAVRGEEVPEFVNLEDIRPPLPPEGPVITKDNLDKYQPQW